MSLGDNISDSLRAEGDKPVETITPKSNVTLPAVHCKPIPFFSLILLYFSEYHTTRKY